MRKFLTKPLIVDAIQFDGSFSQGKEIVAMFPNEGLDLQYEYGQTRHVIKRINYANGRINSITKGDYLVKGALGELFVFRENLFLAMFDDTLTKELK